MVVEEQALRSLCRAILAGLGSRSEEQNITRQIKGLPAQLQASLEL
eukprot:COSAG01_NODE_1910_length_8928_cov_33.079964_8_plen_46_part_00